MLRLLQLTPGDTASHDQQQQQQQQQQLVSILAPQLKKARYSTR